jgi:demethylmenaquinone methyltransferase/2-methoxy-6-polyprenyl-1,4-benzoquinol methylase
MASLSKRPDKEIAPHPPLKGYYEPERQRQDFLNNLFNEFAQDYDWIHKIASFGSSMWHRSRALRKAGLCEGMRMLDIACGTGPVIQCAHQIVGSSGWIVGLDPSTGMLREITRKGLSANLTQGVAEHLPFQDKSFDFITMGYAIRHVQDLHATFEEYFRVLKPGGILLILEISRPSSGIHFYITKFYFKKIVPWIAWIRSRKTDALILMRYFWDTVEYCVPPDMILNTMQEVGFAQTSLSEELGGLIKDFRAVKNVATY